MSLPSAILALKARLQRLFTPFRQWPTDGTLSSFHRYTSHIRNIPLKNLQNCVFSQTQVYGCKVNNFFAYYKQKYKIYVHSANSR